MKSIIAAIVATFLVGSAYANISIVGSSTVYPFSTVIAERSFEQGIDVSVQSTGTGGGMKLFCSSIDVNTPSITNASRAIKSKEKALCFENGVNNIIEYKFGLDGIAFANSINGKKMELTLEQLWTAVSPYGGLPIYWSDIDASLPKIKISIMMPPPSSGTRDAWNSIVMKKGCQVEEGCSDIREDGVVVEVGENDTLLVQKLADDTERFGIFGYSYLDSNRDSIQGSKIEGVDISLEAIQDGSYPISRPLFFYVKGDHIGIVYGLQEYLDEFVSKEAIGDEGYLLDVGLVPLSEEDYKTLSKKVE